MCIYPSLAYYLAEKVEDQIINLKTLAWSFLQLWQITERKIICELLSHDQNGMQEIGIPERKGVRKDLSDRGCRPPCCLSPPFLHSC